MQSFFYQIIDVTECDTSIRPNSYRVEAKLVGKIGERIIHTNRRCLFYLWEPETKGIPTLQIGDLLMGDFIDTQSAPYVIL